MEKSVVGILNHKNGALIQLSNGHVLLWNEEMDQVDSYLYLPEECTCSNIMNNKIYALGVSKRLFENDKVILHNVGSFCIRYPFVLAATLNQRLIAHNIQPTKVILNINYFYEKSINYVYFRILMININGELNLGQEL